MCGISNRSKYFRRQHCWRRLAGRSWSAPKSPLRVSTRVSGVSGLRSMGMSRLYRAGPSWGDRGWFSYVLWFGEFMTFFLCIQCIIDFSLSQLSLAINMESRCYLSCTKGIESQHHMFMIYPNARVEHRCSSRCSHEYKTKISKRRKMKENMPCQMKGEKKMQWVSRTI